AESRNTRTRLPSSAPSSSRRQSFFTAVSTREPCSIVLDCQVCVDTPSRERIEPVQRPNQVAIPRYASHTSLLNLTFNLSLSHCACQQRLVKQFLDFVFLLPISLVCKAHKVRL